jgi:hypothetical protein
MLTELLGLPFKITESSDEFKSYDGPKFSYTNAPLENELFFMCKPLLFEKDIHEPSLQIFDWNGLKVFFPTGKSSALPFDIFSAAFYLVSRYEEYLPYKKDAHERFDAPESVAYKNNFLDKPLVNYWANLLEEKLIQHFPQLEFKKPKYKFISTIDVDSAYAYKEKGLLRTLGGIGKSLFSLNIEELYERISVIIGRQKDPYDTFKYLQYITEKYKLNSIYFFLLADYGLNDKNVPYQSTLLQKQINSIADYAEIGIHPGYGSNAEKQKLQTEHQRLEKILNRHITKSRQHFLKLTLPDTYRNLLELDITDDYTMGYACMPGFRASIANSFYFYDLDSETETKLRVHPFMIMEGTFKYYQNQSPEDFLVSAKKLIGETKKVNGEFISLWHNDSLSDRGIWSGWRKAYEEMIKYALK